MNQSRIGREENESREKERQRYRGKKEREERGYSPTGKPVISGLRSSKHAWLSALTVGVRRGSPPRVGHAANEQYHAIRAITDRCGLAIVPGGGWIVRSDVVWFQYCHSFRHGRNAPEQKCAAWKEKPRKSVNLPALCCFGVLCFILAMKRLWALGDKMEIEWTVLRNILPGSCSTGLTVYILDKNRNIKIKRLFTPILDPESPLAIA